MPFKKLLLVLGVLVIAILGLLAGCIEDQGSNSKKELNSTIEKYSYALGMSAGNELIGIDIDIERFSFAQGLKDALAGNETLLSEAEALSTLNELSQMLQAQIALEQQEQANKNLEEGGKFLSENGTKEGVVTLESGLQYSVLQKGDGLRPGLDDTVIVNYRLTLLDGTEIDSTYSRNQPASFPLNQLIAGLTEGLPLMDVGSSYKFFVPSDLGYGPIGASEGLIPPNAVLIFEIALLDIGG